MINHIIFHHWVTDPCRDRKKKKQDIWGFKGPISEKNTFFKSRTKHFGMPPGSSYNPKVFVFVLLATK